MVDVHNYFILSTILFGIGLAGIVLNRHNLVVVLMCIEILLLAVNTNFIAFSRINGNLHGQVFVFFILTVAAAETAVGLAILMVLYRKRGTIEIDKMDLLKG